MDGGQVARVDCRQSRVWSSRASSHGDRNVQEVPPVTVGSTLPPVERRVLRQDILLGLRSGILSGEIAPGTRLLEIPLATELGVSRGPVREALRQLEQEGLVEFYPHRGAIVVGVGETEIETIYMIRALLEERAFAKAARVVDDTELESLAGMVEK